MPTGKEMPIKSFEINSPKSSFNIRRIRGTIILTNSRRSIRCSFDGTQINLQLRNAQIIRVLCRSIRLNTSQRGGNQIILRIKVIIVKDIEIADIRRKINNTRYNRARSFTHIISKRTRSNNLSKRTFRYNLAKISVGDSNRIRCKRG